MKYSLLASGSKGNACLIETSTTKVLLDCGGTKRYLKECFSSLDIQIDKLDALVVTHAHSDHFSQWKQFLTIPWYTPFKHEHNSEIVSAYQTFYIGDLAFYPIPLSHDIDVIMGYIVFHGEEKLVYLTDTGYIKQNDLMHCIDATYVIIESNYDVNLLLNCARPYLTKMRIMSDTGHLSNEQCFQYCQTILTFNTKELVLAHLSTQANNEELVLKCMMPLLNEYPSLQIKVGKQFEIVSGGSYD